MGRFIGGSSNVAEPLINKKDKTVRAPEPYNLYDHEPGFRNTYGWSVSIDRHAYEPLRHSDIGVYLVNLTAVRAAHTSCSLALSPVKALNN